MIGSPYLQQNRNNGGYNMGKQQLQNMNPLYNQGPNQMNSPYNLNQQMLAQTYGNPYWAQQAIPAGQGQGQIMGQGYYNQQIPNQRLPPGNSGSNVPQSAGGTENGFDSTNGGREYDRHRGPIKSEYADPVSSQQTGTVKNEGKNQITNARQNVQQPTANNPNSNEQMSHPAQPQGGPHIIQQQQNVYDVPDSYNRDSLDPFDQDRYNAYHSGRMSDMGDGFDTANIMRDQKQQAGRDPQPQPRVGPNTTPTTTTKRPTTTTTTTTIAPPTTTIKTTKLTPADKSYNKNQMLDNVQIENGRSRNRGKVRPDGTSRNQAQGSRNPPRRKLKPAYDKNSGRNNPYRNRPSGRKMYKPGGYNAGRYPYYDDMQYPNYAWPEYAPSYFYDNTDYSTDTSPDGKTEFGFPSSHTGT